MEQHRGSEPVTTTTVPECLRLPGCRGTDCKRGDTCAPGPNTLLTLSRRSATVSGMRAELQGKLDPESTLDTARLEDALTDAVFSAVRYLPRRDVLGPLLRHVLPAGTLTDGDLDAAVVTFWPTMPSVLWPGRGVEPDVVVEAGRHVVVFEAKYHSPFGRYELDGQTLHQLSVQWRAASAWAAARGAETTTVVAVTTDASPPGSLEEARRQLAVTAPDLPASDRQQAVQWLRWHALATVFRQVNGLRPHEEAVRTDVLAFMDRRGVSRVFSGFDANDVQLVAQAQRVADERLYPTISTFVHELTGCLGDDGIAWGWPVQGVWATNGLGLTRPQDWARDFVAAPYWPKAWPKRAVQSDYIALYVLFDFINPAVEVGYVQSPRSAARAQQAWNPHFPALADQLAKLRDDYTIAVDTGAWTAPAAQTPVHEANAAWLAGLSGYQHLRLRRRLDITAVSSPDVVREAVLELRSDVETCPALHDMLRDSGQLQTKSPT